MVWFHTDITHRLSSSSLLGSSILTVNCSTLAVMSLIWFRSHPMLQVLNKKSAFVYFLFRQFLNRRAWPRIRLAVDELLNLTYVGRLEVCNDFLPTIKISRISVRTFISSNTSMTHSPKLSCSCSCILVAFNCSFLLSLPFYVILSCAIVRRLKQSYSINRIMLRFSSYRTGLSFRSCSLNLGPCNLHLSSIDRSTICSGRMWLAHMWLGNPYLSSSS